MKRYFELGVYKSEESDGSGVLGQYSSINEAKEAISEFTKQDDEIFIIDELEEQDDGTIRQLAHWMVK
ncbi:hypothetical protein SAMN02910289_00763 [Lachnospiraceae bacterium RM5]|nr:hypothetical protein SAMN02910289_00763 [Lachnospiraceae bacterium RM5]